MKEASFSDGENHRRHRRGVFSRFQLRRLASQITREPNKIGSAELAPRGHRGNREGLLQK